MSSDKRLLLCLATRKGHEVLQAAVGEGPGDRFRVCTFEEQNVAESFHATIEASARDAGIDVVAWRDFRQSPREFVKSHRLEGVLCIGWRYLVPDEAVRVLDGEVLIAHDSLLPRLRGFAPLPTALIAGDTEAGVTFLRAGSDVDNGPVLWQGRFAIDPTDTIADLIEKTLPLYREGAVRYLRGELTSAVPQDESRATYSIWRDADDYRINWTGHADTIERTVRALGPPYLGAQTVWNGRSVVVSEAESLPDIEFAVRQPGKVWKLDDQGRPTVVCGRGLLRILSATADDQSIFPLRSLRSRFQ